jgi:hypothetical protein
MTRFERKNRTDIIYKGCGGITDAFDDMYKQLWRMTMNMIIYVKLLVMKI